ncbi:MAG: diaminopimelate decarboxylase, partial [Candidatus Omnitrophica bacterium]|nr:diaminopimelate decarboxylase [Candidatus Omnitrophota bacterium]
MHDFSYRDGELYCEKVKVAEIAARVGTPFYLYSHKTLTGHYAKLASALAPLKPLICFSMKANSNLALLKALVKKGSGLDIVSGGELFRALKAGCEPGKIVYAGVGKSEEEIAKAIDSGILLFNVESVPELETIDAIARRKKKVVDISLRLNPDVDPKTHRYITTGKKESKFGIDLGLAHEIYTEQDDFPNLRVTGAHVHIGSQITTGGPFVKAFKKVIGFLEEVESHGVKIRYLNLGGGLAAVYKEEKPQTAAQFAARIIPLLKKQVAKGTRIIFEPGRFIAANSGIFVSRVLFMKKSHPKHFIIVDGAMNDLVRPALYGAYHDVLPVKQSRAKARVHCDVVGPICESGDFLAKDRDLPPFQRGDLLAVMTAGAYGFTMSSQYNSRPRAAEVLL